MPERKFGEMPPLPDGVQQIDVKPNPNCKKCYGRGYTGVVVRGLDAGHKCFCPKCVYPAVKEEVRKRGLQHGVSGSVQVKVNLT